MIAFLVKYRLLVSLLFYLFMGSPIILDALKISGEPADIINWISRILIFLFWLIILLDMIKHKLFNKTFWILSMVFIPIFAPVVYLFRRKQLINLRNNRFRS